jgi:chromosome segregation protein
LVRTAAELEPLAAHLLGNCIIVRDLPAAILAAQSAPGLRFVTTAGDVLEPDGTITTGEGQAAVGLISRKSQLRALRDEIAATDARLAELEQQWIRHGDEVDRAQQDRAGAESRLAELSHREAELRHQLGQARQQLAGIEEELAVNRGEIDAIERQLAEHSAARTSLDAQIVAADGQVRALESSIHEREAGIERESRESDARQAELTAARVDLAKTEGQLAGLRQRLAALQADLAERQQVERETRAQIAAAVQRERNCQRKVLAASSQIAELYLRKEKLSREVLGLLERRDAFRDERQALAAESQAAREKLQETQTALHQRELEASDLRHQRTALVDRMREDYELDLAGLYERQRVGQASSLPSAEQASSAAADQPPAVEPDAPLGREAAQQEIQELRRKIAALGNVNMEALSELQELETRSTTLHAQLDDLNQSKATLDEIIRKINQDSQRLFLETLEAIRGHFGELFRKLFGGGRADIVLENESDVLESGIEIIARPPGKELRTLSLLSGGEKTLTAVALLLAVFRSKPSPFCILDEVDAALDEANIDRFITVLREFSAESQFIMITHSKKSMICADVLYGVTMQESGVSKRVSVRLEDVGERGEISPAALDRAEPAALTPPPAESEQEAA